MLEFLNFVLTTVTEIAPTVSLYSPLIITVLTGFWINKRIERYKAKLLVSQSIIKHRADAYFKIKGELNSIYSYIKRVGDWKENTPADIIKFKRIVDKEIHCTKPFWTKEFLNKYDDFMKVCFKTNRGHGKNAAIIGDVAKYDSLDNWDVNYNECFVADGFSETKLNKANDLLLNALSKEFGVE